MFLEHLLTGYKLVTNLFDFLMLECFLSPQVFNRWLSVTLDRSNLNR